MLIKIELSRIRTYIRNLEGFRPNPLDDEPFYFLLNNWAILDLNQ